MVANTTALTDPTASLPHGACQRKYLATSLIDSISILIVANSFRDATERFSELLRARFGQFELSAPLNVVNFLLCSLN